MSMVAVNLMGAVGEEDGMGLWCVQTGFWDAD